MTNSLTLDRKIENAEIGANNFYAYYKNHKLYGNYNYKIRGMIKSSLREKMVDYIASHVRGMAKHVAEILLFKFFNTNLRSSSYGLCCPSNATISRALRAIGITIHEGSVSRIISHLTKLGIMSSKHMFCGASFRFFNFEILDGVSDMLKVSKKQKQRKVEEKETPTTNKTDEEIIAEVKANVVKRTEERRKTFKRISEREEREERVTTTNDVENAYTEALKDHYNDITHIKLSVKEKGIMKNTLMKDKDPVKVIRFAVTNYKDIYKKRFASWTDINAPKYPDLRFIMRMYKIFITESNDSNYSTKKVIHHQYQKVEATMKPQDMARDLQQAILSPRKQVEFEERYKVPFSQMIGGLKGFFNKPIEKKELDFQDTKDESIAKKIKSLDDF